MYTFLITYSNGNQMQYKCNAKSTKEAFETAIVGLMLGDSIKLIDVPDLNKI